MMYKKYKINKQIIEVCAYETMLTCDVSIKNYTKNKERLIASFSKMHPACVECEKLHEILEFLGAKEIYD